MPYKQPFVPIAIFLFASIWTISSPTASPAQQRQPVYLSDPAADLIVSTTQAWGQLGWNTAVKPIDRPASPLKIKDRSYQRGLGHHAPGDIQVDLAGRFKTFEADLGIQWQGGQNVASVVFQIYVDDQKRFESPVVREVDQPLHVSVPVEGGEVLRLVVTDAGDGITCDCADWADARLIPSANPAARPNADQFLDSAPYSRVVTSDPSRIEGTRASRTQEIPAEDLRLSSETLPDASGRYVLATAARAAAIGLEWEENRELRYATLKFADRSPMPDLAAVHLEYWTGESPWQGAWKRLDTPPQSDGHAATWRIGFRKIPGGTPKIRWIFPRSRSPVAISQFQAITRSRMSETSLSLECEAPHAGQPSKVELYNGSILELDSGSPQILQWDTKKPLRLKVRYSIPRPYKADRTVLRLQLPAGPVAVAIEDLLTSDCVYVPSVGLFAVREPAPVTLSGYRQKIAGRKTVLQEVASRPDQTFAEAMAAVHNPIQDLGPTMLSLACDNRKFVVEREGAVLLNLYDLPDQPPIELPKQYRLAPIFGTAAAVGFVRYLDGGWLPIVVNSCQSGGVQYRQRTYVAPLDAAPPAGAPRWLRDRAACVVEYEIENATGDKANASLKLALTAGQKPAAWETAENRYSVTDGDRLVLLADTSHARPLDLATEGATLRAAGVLPAKTQVRLVIWIPAWKTGLHDAPALVDDTSLRSGTEAYWKSALETAMQVELPDPLLTNVLRASQVHCLIAARNESRESRISPWIASDRYGPLESEANSILHGMGLWGHAEFAQRGLDFFLARYNEAGYLTTGYTLVGTGWNLWTLARYFDRTQDRQWFEHAAPTVLRACQWIVRQRAKTRLVDAHGQRLPGYGLMPPGVSADWNRFAYRFFNDAYFCAGLTAAAKALKDVGNPAADDLLRDAASYRDDLLHAFRWTQARMPVVQLANGTWTHNHPGIVGFFGNVEEFTPGEDWNRSWAGSVEIGSHYLPALGLLPPKGPETQAILDYLEDHQFLRSGMGEYTETANHKDPFDLGGFAKVQPYYGRIPEIYALRDDVKPYIRSYFNAIPALLSRENLSFWEHFHNMGAWNKTHETGWFLAESRMVFVQERGNQLWLAPFVTQNWLKDGMSVKVERAATRFGQVSYQIRSSAAQDSIEATVTSPPTSPQAIVIRLRHPGGKKMAKVTLNGQPYDQFDPDQETVTFSASNNPIVVRAQY